MLAATEAIAPSLPVDEPAPVPERRESASAWNARARCEPRECDYHLGVYAPLFCDEMRRIKREYQKYRRAWSGRGACYPGAA